MKNSKHDENPWVFFGIVKLGSMLALFLFGQIYIACTKPKQSDTKSQGVVETSYYQDSLKIERLDMGDNLHFCTDWSHKTCDSVCTCDGMECGK